MKLFSIIPLDTRRMKNGDIKVAHAYAKSERQVKYLLKEEGHDPSRYKITPLKSRPEGEIVSCTPFTKKMEVGG